MSDDPTVKELADQEPFDQEVARHSDDPAALKAILDELLHGAPKEAIDDSAALTQFASVPEDEWPIVLLVSRTHTRISAHQKGSR